MKKTILFLLLAWIAIYAGNHLLFKSVPKNSEVRRRSARRPIQRGEKLTLGGRICLEVERIRRQMSPQGTHYPSKTQMPPEEAINGLLRTCQCPNLRKWTGYR